MIKLYDLILELDSEKILIPRRSKEERSKSLSIITQKKIQQYIKNGSKGDLDLSSTIITSLPNNLTVTGNLDLRGSKIKSLPDNLTVVGYLDLVYTPIKSLPNNLTVRNHLNLYGTPISKKYSIKQIKQMVPNVKGDIFI